MLLLLLLLLQFLLLGVPDNHVFLVSLHIDISESLVLVHAVSGQSLPSLAYQAGEILEADPPVCASMQTLGPTRTGGIDSSIEQYLLCFLSGHGANFIAR